MQPLPECQLEATAERLRDKKTAASQQSAAESYHEVHPSLLSYLFTYGFWWNSTCFDRLPAGTPIIFIFTTSGWPKHHNNCLSDRVA